MFRSQLFDHLQGVVFRAWCCYYLLCLFASFIWYTTKHPTDKYIKHAHT